MTTISEEEENYIRLSLLLTGVAPRAVRCNFDSCADFAPAVLPSTIKRESSKLSGLKVKRVINQAQWNILFPSHGIPNSNEFDVTLMICLLRNLTKLTPPATGFDRLPPTWEITDVADLARIKYYRNYFAHLDDTKIDNSDFQKAWMDVADAVGRLGGQKMAQECSELKVKTLDQSNKEIILHMKQAYNEVKQLKQSLEVTKMEVEEQIACHKELKISHELKSQKIEESHSSLKTDHERLKTDHEQKTKELENLAKSYVSLKSDHEEKTKEVEQLAKSYVSLKTDHEEKTKEVENLKTDTQTLAKSYITLKTDYDKLKAAQEDPVPKNIREHILRQLETWKKDDEMFVDTRAATRVLECLKTENCVIATGSSGMGKTFTVRHVALQMAGDGYDILPITNPDDIVKFYNPDRKTIFVIDNFCGTYTLNQNNLDKWKSLSDTIIDILKDNKVKIIVSCRLQVYQDELFKTFPLFTSCECNFMSKDICLSLKERQSLAKLYLKSDALKISEFVDLYDFFPLLCKLYKENPNFDVTEYFKNPFSVYEAEISKLWTEGAYTKYCALALCVMFNNHLKEEWLTEDIDKDLRTVIKNTCEACKLERGTSRLVIRDELESLTNTFIRKDTEIKSTYSLSLGQSNAEVGNNVFYCTIHDKLFDYLVSYFGKVMIPTLIKNSDSRLLEERFLFQQKGDSHHFRIIIPNKYQHIYLQRMIDDWVKGHLPQVFGSMNMKTQKFRDIFLNHLEGIEPALQYKLIQMCNVSYHTTDELYQRGWWKDYSSTTPLIHCCLVGDIDMVQWFCDHGSDVNHCNSDGESPLYISCLKGHHGIVSKLMSNKADVNLCTKYGESPLYVACDRGYTEIVTKLLDNKADVNLCTEYGESPLYIACYGGNTEIVTKLLDNKADVNQYAANGVSPLYIACDGGYTEIVTKLLDNKADVNQCTDNGVSPLYIACDGGYTEIVTKLLDNKAVVNQCKKYGESPLYIACSRGYTEIVTKLLDNKADVNHCTKIGISPLYIACREGYTKVVIKLLDNKADVNHCTNDGESPLYIACYGGYTEIVTKLLDNKADVNQCTDEGESPLYIACGGGYTEIVAKLLRQMLINAQIKDYHLWI